jgi:microcompartment protein CcmK/EutM
LAVVSAEVPASAAEEVAVDEVGWAFSVGVGAGEVALMLLGSSFLQPATEMTNATAQ